MKLKEYFAQLKIDLKPMTFSEKVDHIWSYNKELILITAGVLFLVIGLLVAFITKPDVVFCGFLVNAEINDEGNAYLTSDYGEVVGVTGKQEVQLMTGFFNPNITSAGEANESTWTQISALCQERALDYVMADELTIKALTLTEMTMDLRNFFTEEEFAQLQDKILYVELEDGTKIPCAVKLNDTKFYKDCISYYRDLYICFVANTPNVERCHEFWDYLNNWK